jgi:DNA-binding response OmpR family regulator
VFDHWRCRKTCYQSWEDIHVYINRLRKKIETPAQRRFIYNEPKVGYRFQADD